MVGRRGMCVHIHADDATGAQDVPDTGANLLLVVAQVLELDLDRIEWARAFAARLHSARQDAPDQKNSKEQKTNGSLRKMLCRCAGACVDCRDAQRAGEPHAAALDPREIHRNAAARACVRTAAMAVSIPPSALSP